MEERRRGKERKYDLELLRRRVKRLAKILKKDNPIPAAFEVGSQLGLVLMAAIPYCEELTFWFFAKEMAATRRTATGRCRVCGDKVGELDSGEYEVCPACEEGWRKEEEEWKLNPEA